ncbi:MAG: AmmeMemoRadiSam system protein B [Caldilineaceae bacterium]|nr:AmmeMemoRadiSam system protein B [Caldilineaceae bacterium]
MKSSNSIYPKLRSLSVRHHTQDGRPYLHLSDPQRITEAALLVPQPLGALLAFCDGAHNPQAMVTAFQRHAGSELPLSIVEELLRHLDEALMLENERFHAAYAELRTAYRTAPYRPAALAGRSYPAQKQPLWRRLQDYLEAADTIEPVPIDWSRPVGLLSPHIDYPRGGAVYAQIWKRAAQVAREAELAIMLGTDHYGADAFTLTRQHYATPYGVLPTDQAVVDQLAQVIGEEAAFAGELRHRGEHSLELVAVWLHHMRAGQACPFVPILCGGLHRFFQKGATPAQDPLLNRVIATLQQATKGRRTLVIASGDLAHVGPAFGGAPLTTAGRQQLQAADQQLINRMSNGDSEGFFDAIQQIRDANNVCGVAPIYLTMRTLGAAIGSPIRGEQVGYATCPADDDGTSVVTVGGMLFQ